MLKLIDYFVQIYKLHRWNLTKKEDMYVYPAYNLLLKKKNVDY